jgi:hypothetical protein
MKEEVGYVGEKKSGEVGGWTERIMWGEHDHHASGICIKMSYWNPLFYTVNIY